MATTIEGGIDRRAELLRAGRAVLAEKGLDAARVSEIVARAGVAQGTFYLYFPSKVSLVVALFEEFNGHAVDALRQAMHQAPTLYEAVFAAVTESFAVMEQYRDVLGILHARMGDREVWQECLRQQGMVLNYIATLITEAQHRGEVAPELDPHVTADLLAGLIEHAGHMCFVYNTQTVTPAYIEQVVSLIRRALGVTKPA